MANTISLDFYNPDGTLKPFEDFASELEGIYKQLESVSGNQFINFLTSPKNEYDPAALLSKYHFLDRKIYINSEITEEIAQEVLEKIQFWNGEDEFNSIPTDDEGFHQASAIQIYINTPGGDLFSTLQIVDTIRSSKTPVVTVVTGTAYSGGFLIAIAGDVRLAFPHATFLFHEGSNMIIGDAHKALQQSDFYKSTLKKMKKLVLDCTKIDYATYEKHQKDDWFFGVEKAAQLGVIDEICNDVNGGIGDEQ